MAPSSGCRDRRGAKETCQGCLGKPAHTRHFGDRGGLSFIREHLQSHLPGAAPAEATIEKAASCSETSVMRGSSLPSLQAPRRGVPRKRGVSPACPDPSCLTPGQARFTSLDKPARAEPRLPWKRWSGNRQAETRQDPGGRSGRTMGRLPRGQLGAQEMQPACTCSPKAWRLHSKAPNKPTHAGPSREGERSPVKIRSGDM